MENVNYSRTGRWSQCGWCGCIYRADLSTMQQTQYSGGQLTWEQQQVHWCGAPFQTKPIAEHSIDNIPDEWIPGKSPLTPKHYPESPFMKMFEPSETSSPWSPKLQEKIDALEKRGEDLLKTANELRGIPCQ
jgi:hypothetical protein